MKVSQTPVLYYSLVRVMFRVLQAMGERVSCPYSTVFHRIFGGFTVWKAVTPYTDWKMYLVYKEFYRVNLGGKEHRRRMVVYKEVKT